MNKGANPQGKGLVAILDDVTSTQPSINIIPKTVNQVSSELFTSMFVLESDFAFRPVIGKEYFLYMRNGRFRLSMIEPDQWNEALFGRFVGRCTLHRDLTWTLAMDETAAGDHHLSEFIKSKQHAFKKELESAGEVQEVLPVYYESLPYYQRLFASALASSLRRSMELSGISRLSYRGAKGLLSRGR